MIGSNQDAPPPIDDHCNKSAGKQGLTCDLGLRASNQENLDFPRFDGQFFLHQTGCFPRREQGSRPRHNFKNISLRWPGLGAASRALAREFEPCAATIDLWRKEAKQDSCERGDGMTTPNARSCSAFAGIKGAASGVRYTLKGRAMSATGPRTMVSAWFAQGEIPSQKSPGS